MTNPIVGIVLLLVAVLLGYGNYRARNEASWQLMFIPTYLMCLVMAVIAIVINT